jgi:hypothetical protein
MFAETISLTESSKNWRQIWRPYTGSAYNKNYKKWLKISIPALQMNMYEITEIKAHLFVLINNIKELFEHLCLHLSCLLFTSNDFDNRYLFSSYFQNFLSTVKYLDV